MALLNLLNIIWQVPGQAALENIGWKYYLPFIILTAISVVVVPLTFPDTRNMALEDIMTLFGDEVRVNDDSSPELDKELGFEHKEVEVAE